MYSIYLYDGDTLIACRRVDSLPSEADVRSIMAVRSATKGEVYERFNFVNRYEV